MSRPTHRKAASANQKIMQTSRTQQRVIDILQLLQEVNLPQCMPQTLTRYVERLTGPNMSLFKRSLIRCTTPAKKIRSVGRHEVLMGFKAALSRVKRRTDARDL